MYAYLASQSQAESFVIAWRLRWARLGEWQTSSWPDAGLEVSSAMSSTSWQIAETTGGRRVDWSLEAAGEAAKR